jgi:sialate O-acetylesterase
MRSSEVTAPTAARYAWAGYPDGCNLYNGAGLPAAPFRISNK